MSNTAALAVSPELSEREELSLLRSLFQASDYGVLFSGLDRRDICCNRRFDELFGLEGGETVRRSPEEVRALVLPRVRDPVGFILTLERIYGDPRMTLEDELELAGPDVRFVRRYSTPVLDGDRVVGRLWTFLDITRTRHLERQVVEQAEELKVRSEQLSAALKHTSGKLHYTETVLAKAQRKLVEAEKLTAAGVLAASVAHDIDNILTPLTIELSLADRDEPHERAEALDTIKDQLERLSLLTRRLLGFARPGLAAAEQIAIAPLISRTAGLVMPQATLAGIAVNTDCDPQTPDAVADPIQIEQVLVNLALNGIQAMQPARSGTLEIKAFAEREGVCLQVWDTGPGIPPAVRRRLYEPFVSTKPGGTGLGLFSCRRIVMAHNGAMRVRSVAGKGTRFSVWLPSSASTPSVASTALEEHAHVG